MEESDSEYHRRSERLGLPLPGALGDRLGAGAAAAAAVAPSLPIVAVVADANAAGLRAPRGIAVVAAPGGGEDVLVADSGGNRVRRLALRG